MHKTWIYSAPVQALFATPTPLFIINSTLRPQRPSQFKLQRSAKVQKKKKKLKIKKKLYERILILWYLRAPRVGYGHYDRLLVYIIRNEKRLFFAFPTAAVIDEIYPEITIKSRVTAALMSGDLGDPGCWVILLLGGWPTA